MGGSHIRIRPSRNAHRQAEKRPCGSAVATFVLLNHVQGKTYEAQRASSLQDGIDDRAKVALPGLSLASCLVAVEGNRQQSRHYDASHIKGRNSDDKRRSAPSSVLILRLTLQRGRIKMRRRWPLPKSFRSPYWRCIER